MNMAGRNVGRSIGEPIGPGIFAYVTKKKTCEHEGCRCYAKFNVAGTKCGKFCQKHKLEGMLNVSIGGGLE